MKMGQTGRKIVTGDDWRLTARNNCLGKASPNARAALLTGRNTDSTQRYTSPPRGDKWLHFDAGLFFPNVSLA